MNPASSRRRWLRQVGVLLRGSMGALAGLAVSGCERTSDAQGAGPAASAASGWLARLSAWRQPAITGAFVGAAHERGHRLRDAPPRDPGSREQAPRDPVANAGGPARSSADHKVSVLIIGAGVAGLSAARQLQRAGVTDFAVLDLEDVAGGNSRWGTVGGIECPWGAHYLPVPDRSDEPLRAFLRETGVLTSRDGQDRYDEKALCHAPQERLLVAGQWHAGLLPPAAGDLNTQDEYHRFAQLVREARSRTRFAIPLPTGEADAYTRLLDASTFAQWLDAQHLRAAALRWYLDYCCLDDYGVDTSGVSAWAGLHYFASRHGFFPAGGNEQEDHSEVLTWPRGNGWLVDHLVAPQAARITAGALAWRVVAGSTGVEVDVWRAATARNETWRAEQVILAVPLFVAMRLLAQQAPAPWQAHAAILKHSAWMVANVHVTRTPAERPGVPRAWDNVVMRGSGPGSGAASGPGHALGYVDALHQSLASHRGATVFTCYRALGTAAAARQALLAMTWQQGVETVLGDLAIAHEDIRACVSSVDIMRYGHAMAVPAPGARVATAALRPQSDDGRIHLAHSDLSGYSIFEEAFAHGSRAGQRCLQQLSGSRTPR